MLQGDIDLLEFLTWVQHMSATPTGVTANMVWYYKEQAARGNSAAILNLAVCHLSGVGMLEDSVAGVALMRDAASRGNPMAVRRNIVRAIRGLDHLQTNPYFAVSWALLSQLLRAPMLQAHSLGLCCWTGEGTAVDLDEAQAWLKQAADQGVVMAAESLELLEQERKKQGNES